MAGLHLSVKDVMSIVKLLILILQLIAKLRECISYFRSSGGQTVARSNVTGREGTTNNQMGIELQNTDENSIIASVEASTSAGNGAHAKRMATMKENKGKEVMDKATRPETQSQLRPSAGDKRKTLSKTLDLENLPSRRGKTAKHGSSKPGVVKPSLPTSQPSVQVFDVDSSAPIELTSSKTTAPASFQPSQRISMNLIENEDLAWERFEKAVSGEDIAACYDMSLKDFEHSGVHDLFKAMSKFIAVSRQATELDKTRVLLETRIQEVKEDCKGWAEVAVKATDEAKEMQNLIEELKADIVEKDTRLDYLQKKNDELSAILMKVKEDAIMEFKASKQYTDVLDVNYAAGFEDFRMDIEEHFPEVDFSSIKLNVGAASSLLQTSSEDINIEEDATTHPIQDDPTSGDNPQ